MELPNFFKSMYNSMYGWTIILLVFLSLVASYSKHSFPTNLAVAIIVSAALDILIKKLILKKRFKFPYSAIITGIIVGSIVQFSSSLWIVVTASIIAICSKFAIRLKGSHIFNPAALGLLVSLFIFSSGDEWWAAVNHNFYGVVIPLSAILILANYKAGKLGVSLSFLLVMAILSYSTEFIPMNSFTLKGVMNLIYSMQFYFAFVMVSEPKTSPYGLKQQIAFGVLAAILTFAFSFYNIKFALIIALLAGNLVYALHRSYFVKPAADK